MRALVTGSAGFVGRHFTDEFFRRGYAVRRCDPLDSATSITDAFDIFRNETTRYDLVVHAAAQAPHRAAIDSQPRSHIYNQLLDAAMFDWAVRTGQGRVLYLSSCAVLDEVPDDYGQLKLSGERMAGQARAAGVPVTVVRPFSGYGEDQGTNWPFGAFRDRARRRLDPFAVWGDGRQVRDWIHVDDVVRGALAVAESGTDDAISLCTGIGTSMLELARLFCTAEQRRALGVYRPLIALQPDMPGGTSRRVGDPSALHRYYTPQVTLEEGVKRAMVGGSV